jgi:amino acid permease
LAITLPGLSVFAIISVEVSERQLSESMNLEMLSPLIYGFFFFFVFCPLILFLCRSARSTKISIKFCNLLMVIMIAYFALTCTYTNECLSNAWL